MPNDSDNKHRAASAKVVATTVDDVEEARARKETTKEGRQHRGGNSNHDAARKYKILSGVLASLIVVVIGVVVWLVTAGKNPAPSPPTTAPSASPTEIPTITLITPAPTTKMPTSSPTYFLYPRPSLQDCQLIASGQALANQSALYDHMYKVFFDVGLNVDINPELLFETLKTQIQKSIMPKIAGCDDGKDAQTPPGTDHDEQKFWIRNAFILDLKDSGGECGFHNGAFDGAVSCFELGLYMNISVYDDNRPFIYLAGRITEAFGENILEELGLGSPFTEIRFTSFGPHYQTQPPTLEPTAVESSRPTRAPIVGF